MNRWWRAYILEPRFGGGQPAQKWLKDRKSHALSAEDIAHYQKMIVALVETGKLMVEIDKLFDLKKKKLIGFSAQY